MIAARHSQTLRSSRRVRKDREDHLQALGELVDSASTDPSKLFDHGLALLVQHLRVNRALLSRVGEQGLEVLWWSMPEGQEPDPELLDQAYALGMRVLDHPNRVLMIRDLGVEGPQAGAYLGSTLTQGGSVSGVLAVFCTHSRGFTRAQIAMLKAVANLFGKSLEIEQLKYELRLTRDALDLTSAVVEDSVLEAPQSRLPNALYLDIWMKASLYLARRRGEAMVLVRWRMFADRPFQRKLKDIANALRGEDLLVDLGKEEFLLLLPRTAQDGALVLLERIRLQLGPIPMGATVWDPMNPDDRDDLVLRDAIRRASQALAESRKGPGPAQTAWELLPGPREVRVNANH